MDPFLKERCGKILTSIEKKPIARMITDKWTDFSGKLTLSIIKEKLQNDQYLTPFDFSLDLRLLLEPRNDGDSSNQIQNLILDDITIWLNNKLLNMPRSEDEMLYMKIQKCVQKLQYACRALAFSAPKTAKQTVDSSLQRQPPSNREGQYAALKRIESMQQKIDRIKRPEDLQEVLRILQKYVPQLTLSNEVIIEGRFITKQCVAELRNFLNSIQI